MKRKNSPSNTPLLALMLFCLSGVMLAYNIYTAEGGELAVSLSALAGESKDTKDNIISTYAINHLNDSESILVSGNAKTLRDYELTEPIVKPPKE